MGWKVLHRQHDHIFAEIAQDKNHTTLSTIFHFERILRKSWRWTHDETLSPRAIAAFRIKNSRNKNYYGVRWRSFTIL